MKIYDCFTFFNELDVLELRLEELYNVVDKFVIVEADKTHSGIDKKFILEKNKKRFSKWWNKIDYIKLKNSPNPRFNKLYQFLVGTNNGFLKYFAYNTGLGNWRLENYQRNKIIEGLSDAKDDDIIIISDLDEIPSAKSIVETKKALSEEKYDFVRIKMKDFRYYFNGYFGEWKTVRATRMKTLRNKLHNKPHNIKTNFLEKFYKYVFKKPKFHEKIINGGWHFSWIGDKKKIEYKLKSFSHSELLRDKKSKKKKEPLRFIDIDLNGLPCSLIKRKEKAGYKEYLK